MDLQHLSDLADPRVKEIWDEKNTQLSKELEYSIFGFSDKNAEIQNTKIENFTGLGLAELTGELEPYNREDIQAGFSVTLTPAKYTKASPISEEMYRYNLWPKINNVVSAAANACNGRIDTQCAKQFYLGFGTTFQIGGDGVALFSASHPMGDGSTQSNTLGAVPLSYDNLKLARQAMNRMYDDKGIQMMPARRMRLIVGIENEDNALQTLRSIGNPDSANRTGNVFNMKGGYSIDLKVASWIPVAYNKYWFLIDLERAQYMNHIIWGWRPRFDDDKLVNNGSRLYTGSVAFINGFSSFQFVIGANSTT
jgi:hypothetical protein